MTYPITSSSATRGPAKVGEARGSNEAYSSGVSWAAVIAGAFVTAALSLALLTLGTGIGFSSVSPWTNAGATASTIGWTAVLWLVFMQLIASSVGGYLAGRLRTKWVNVHTHEVFFRDTAHGFLVWAVALVVTAAFLTSAATVIGGTAASTTAAVWGPAQSRTALEPNAYLIDTLLRQNVPGSDHDNAPVRGEIGPIFANAVREGNLPPADRTYLAQLVAAKTGVSEPDAEKRVDDAYIQARQVADSIRKAAAHAMYWTFLAFLIGAFCASIAATVGGRERDRVVG